ncbi:DUF3710 domain-containing protein [Georgenia yuyongxinii]|uniref:DUF3710 domain-containing protein n=1 Tax=Georgenia yuyongxinii TaxID=2589797 RepID=A0A552WX26_9MICO|nr:DUF3710 domain-containing protein [Georgenia yuyongxinii]TRW47139.1 DUF3710 domain-containing protein [Georgenia yuyongxinii]
MGLFTRRKRDTAADGAPEGVVAEETTAEAGTTQHADTDPRRGPHDVADEPDLGKRLDLGALRVPARAGMQLRLEVEKKTKNIVAVTLGLSGSAMQLQVFAAPRTLGIWEELREEITASVAKQGGTTDEIDGPFGRELLARLPVRTPEGQTSHRPARFVGVDGPRWFLRAVLTGNAAVDATAAADLEAVLADVVVVRGTEARAPRDVLLLHAPGRAAAPAVPPTQTPALDVTRRGPEISEVR